MRIQSATAASSCMATRASHAWPHRTALTQTPAPSCTHAARRVANGLSRHRSSASCELDTSGFSSSGTRIRAGSSLACCKSWRRPDLRRHLLQAIPEDNICACMDILNNFPSGRGMHDMLQTILTLPFQKCAIRCRTSRTWSKRYRSSVSYMPKTWPG